VGRPALILIWRVSGAGKSRYCKWLAERGYTYLDHDTIATQRIHDGSASRLEELWMTMRIERASTRDCVRAIGDQRVVAEFGARPDESSLLQLLLLIDLGASAWWFDGDRGAARESWLHRDIPADEEFWRIQMARVDSAWLRIAEIFRSRIGRTIGPGPAYLPESQIDRLMFGDLPDQDGGASDRWPDYSP
jgi:hypothetical protein